MAAHRPGRFATTHWSLVLAAARDDDAEGRRALDALCEQYWYPLYVFVRRRGYKPEDAQDLTQAFLTRLLDRRDIGRASAARGRFRSFLLTSLKNFLANEYDRARTLKRGGGVSPISLDLAAAERRFGSEPASSGTPEEQFDRKWALTVLERALGQLRAEYERDGKSALFARLAELMTAGADDSYRSASADLGMTEGAARVTVHRMRRRLRDILRADVSQTVDPSEMDDEIRFLIEAVGPPRRSA